jgi:Protein phosphatase 2C
MGGQAASLAARTMSVLARSHYEGTASPPDDDAIREWIDDTRDAIRHAAHVRGKRPRDFAATLICVISDATQSIVVHIGDGCVVGRSATTNEWIALTWPSNGECASTTYFITDDPEPRVAIQRHLEPLTAIVAFTDGIERLALDFANHRPHGRFFEGIAAPVFKSSAVRRDYELSAQLARYLDSDAVNARTDDDKTLLIAVHR